MTKSSLEQRLKDITEGNKNFAAKEIKNTFPMVQLGNREMRFGIHYSYLRPLQYLASEDAIYCAGNGQEFAIYGKNMSLLFEMMCACAVSKVIEGEIIEIAEVQIFVERVLMPSDDAPEENIPAQSRQEEDA